MHSSLSIKNLQHNVQKIETISKRKKIIFRKKTSSLHGVRSRTHTQLCEDLRTGAGIQSANRL